MNHSLQQLFMDSYGYLWVLTNQLIPQKAMQNHSVVMVMGSVIFSALITPPQTGLLMVRKSAAQGKPLIKRPILIMHDSPN